MARRSSYEYWLELLRPLVDGTVEAASQVVTGQPDVQAWLRPRLEQAAMESMDSHDVRGLIAVQSSLEDELRSAFPHLHEAIEDLTHGTAHLVVDWHPEAPHRGKIDIRFDVPVPVAAMRVVDSAEAASFRAVLHELAALLPRSRPFVGHPHTLGALIILGRHHLAMQLIDQVHDNHRIRWLRVFPTGVEARGRIAFEQGHEALAEYFQMRLAP